MLPHIACTDTGLLSNFLFLIQVQECKKDSDYRPEMSWDVSRSRREYTVFPGIKKANETSVVVLGRLMYDTVLGDYNRFLVTLWNKDWLL